MFLHRSHALEKRGVGLTSSLSHFLLVRPRLRLAPFLLFLLIFLIFFDVATFV